MVEEVFVQARNAEPTAEEMLVDDGWKLVEVERVVVVNDNRTNGNGPSSNDVGPTVEVALGNSHDANRDGEAALVNDNGRHDGESDQRQQTLFSRAEFLVLESNCARGPHSPASRYGMAGRSYTIVERHFGKLFPHSVCGNDCGNIKHLCP